MDKVLKEINEFTWIFRIDDAAEEPVTNLYIERPANRD